MAVYCEKESLSAITLSASFVLFPTTQTLKGEAAGTRKRSSDCRNAGAGPVSPRDRLRKRVSSSPDFKLDEG